MSARRRWIAGLAGLSLVAAVFFVPTPETTDAAWTDAEHTASSFTAAPLVAPVIMAVPTCEGLLGGGVVTIRWQWSADRYPGFGPLTNAQWAYNTAGNNWQFASSGATSTIAPNVYETSFSQGLITNLLTFLLGGTITFRLRTVAGTWVSSAHAAVVYNAPLLGGRTCTVVNP